jgi:hypothetical protein
VIVDNGHLFRTFPFFVEPTAAPAVRITEVRSDSGAEHSWCSFRKSGRDQGAGAWTYQPHNVQYINPYNGSPENHRRSGGSL